MAYTERPADEADHPRVDPDGPSRRAPAWAWGVCWMMFASTVLNYMDRQAISLVEPELSAEFRLSNQDFGWVMSVFQLTYAVLQVPAGFLVDRWDLRRTYAGAVAFWSLAGVASAFAPGLSSLLVLRALLGVGESFNWPCALRVTGQVLSPADRSLGNGIFNSGAAVGAVVTPVAVTLLTARFGWRTSFAVLGLLGFVWAAAWLALFGGERRGRLAAPVRATERGPEPPRPGLSAPALGAYGGVAFTALLVAATAYWRGPYSIWWAIAWLMFGTLAASLALPTRALERSTWAASLGEVVRLRRFWILVVVSISINVCWHFLVSWLPIYLRKDRGMTFLAGGLWSAVPFLAADVGNLGGGAFSRWLSGRGLNPARARTAVMAGCTLLVAAGAGVGWVRSNTVVIALLSVMAMGTAAFMANYFAFTQEVSARHTGLIVGILGGLGNLCAAGVQPLAGIVKDTTGGFGPIFLLVGLLPFLGIGALAAGWGREPRVGPGTG